MKLLTLFRPQIVGDLLLQLSSELLELDPLLLHLLEVLVPENISLVGQPLLHGFMLRTKSWNNRWLLEQGWGGWIAAAEIWAAFWAVDGILASMDAAGTI